MSPRPSSAPSDASALLDDFEWPPQADDVSVHELDDDPWITIEIHDPEDSAGAVAESDASTPAAPAPPPR